MGRSYKLTHFGCGGDVRKMKIATAQPPKNTGRKGCVTTGAERGVSNGDDQVASTRNSAMESIPASRLPPRLRLGCGNQWAVTPKLTMIDGRQRSIGAL